MAPLTPSRLQSSAARVATWLAAAALFAALTLIASFAGIGAYIAMVLALPVLLIVLFNWRWFTDQDGSFPLLFALAYAIFAVLIVFPNRPAGSAIYIFDFFPFALAIAVYVGLSKLRTEHLLSLLAHACLLGTAISVGVGAYQVFGLNAGRADGTGSAINYGNISLLLGFLTLAPLFSRRNWRWYFAAGPVLGLTAALMSGSRSIVPVGLALAVVLLVHLIVWYRASSRVAIWRVALMLVGGLAVMGIVLALLDARQLDRITTIFGKLAALLRGENVNDSSLAIRLDYYQSSITAFLQAPFTGFGWGQAVPVVERYTTVFDSGAIRRIVVPHLHNDVLQFAVSFGVFGVVAYLIALAAPVAAWIRSKRRQLGYASYCIFAVVLSFLVMGLTNTNFVFEPPKVMFCFAAALAAALAAKRAGDSAV